MMISRRSSRSPVKGRRQAPRKWFPAEPRGRAPARSAPAPAPGRRARSSGWERWTDRSRARWARRPPAGKIRLRIVGLVADRLQRLFLVVSRPELERDRGENPRLPARSSGASPLERLKNAAPSAPPGAVKLSSAEMPELGDIDDENRDVDFRRGFLGKSWHMNRRRQ